MAGVAFKKTFSYAGFEMQPKHYEKPKICLLNVELELKRVRRMLAPLSCLFHPVCSPYGFARTHANTLSLPPSLPPSFLPSFLPSF